MSTKYVKFIKNSTNIKTTLNTVGLAFDSIKNINASAHIGSNGLFATDALKAYATQLSGLTATQQKMALMTTNLTAAQRAQVLSYMAETAAAKTLTAQQLIELSADQKRALIDAGIITGKQARTGATITLTKAELKKIIADKAILTKDKELILSAFGVTEANLTEASSWEILGKSMGKWLFTTPAGWATLAIGAVVGLTVAYANLASTAESAAKAQEELKEAESDLASARDELTGINDKIAEIKSKGGELGISDQAELDRLETERAILEDQVRLLELKKELAADKSNREAVKAVMGNKKEAWWTDSDDRIIYETTGRKDTDDDGSFETDKDSEISGTIGDYEKEIEEIEKEISEWESKPDSEKKSNKLIKLREKKQEVQDKITANKNELIDMYLRDTELMGQITGDDPASVAAREKLQKEMDFLEQYIYTKEQLAKIKFDDFIKDPNNKAVSEGFKDIQKDGEVTAQEITDLANKFPALSKYMSENGITAEVLAAEYAKVSDESKKMTDSWQSLSVALKEVESAYELFNEVQKDFNSTGALSSENIQKILNKFPDLEDELYEYIMGMRTGASVMDLLKTKSDDMATMSAEAFRRMYLSSNSISKDMKKQFGDTFEAVGLGWDNTQSVMANVNSQIVDANGNVTSTFSTQWANACANAGASVSAFAQGLSTLFSGGIDNIEVKNGVLYSKAADGGTANLVNTSAHKILNDLNEKGQNSEYWDTYGSLVSFGSDGKVTQTSRDSVWSAVNKSYWGQYNANLKNQEEFERKQKEFEERMKQLGTSTDSSSSDKNNPSYEDPTDAIINRINLRSKEIEKQEEEIQNLIEIAELENDYKKQISSTNDLISTRKKRVEELNTANTGLHQMAEDLRNSTPQWNEEKWFDSQGNATEAYNSLYNSSSKEEQEKIKDQFEKISKIKESWVDNDKEIVELNKEILQDAERLNELYSDLHNSVVGDIEHTRDMALEANPFTDTSSYYKQLQEEYHKEAERLRALDPEKYKEEIQELQLAWWDAQKSIADWSLSNSERWINERNTYGDWEQYGDNEVAAWKRVLDRFKSEFPSELDKIREIEENYFNARKDAMEKSISDIEDYIDARNHYDDWDSFGDSELEAIKRQTQIIEDAYKQRLLSSEEYVERLEEYSQRIYSLAQDQINESLSNIDKYIDARNHYNDWDTFGDSEIKAIKRQCKILDKAYAENLMSLKDYTEKSEEYAQRLYSIGREYIDKSLSDIDRYIDTRNAYDDWDNWGDTEIEAIKRQIDILDRAYAEKLMSLEEYTQKTEEYSKKLYSVSKNNIIETISEMIEDYEKMRQDEKDALSFESSQYSSLKTLLQSYYDVINAISEAQHEINKELRASKSMYEYLNEETRKLLFNQEDYDVLSEKLLDIQSAANELQEKYNNDILSASEETIAEITSQYQMQYETMMKQYEIAKAELDVAKKRQKLDNVLAERNVRMFVNGQWQWVANTQNVIDAQNELADAEIEREQRETSLKQIDSINNLTKAQDDITTQINYLETDLEKIRDKWSEMQKMLNGESHEVAEALKQISEVSSPELKRVIEETGGNVTSFSVLLSESIDTMSTVINTNLDTATSDILDNVVESVDDITSTVSDSISDIHDNISDGIDNINKTITDGLEEYSDAIKALVDKINELEIEEEDRGTFGDANWGTGTPIHGATQENTGTPNFDTTGLSIGWVQMSDGSTAWWNGEVFTKTPSSSSSSGGSSSSGSGKTSSSSSSSSSGKTSSSSGGSSSSSSSSSNKVNTTDQYVKSSNGVVQSNPNWDGKNKGGVGSFYKHADGTRYTPGGLTALGEEGFEAFINNNGHLIPINQPTIGNIGAGGIVFNQAQMDNLRNLWDLSNMNRILPHISTLADNKQSTVIDNSIHINGLTVGEQGNEDWINGLRRYVATHK